MAAYELIESVGRCCTLLLQDGSAGDRFVPNGVVHAGNDVFNAGNPSGWVHGRVLVFVGVVTQLVTQATS